MHFAQSSDWQSMQNRPISYDDILELIEEIESGTIYDCSFQQMEQINKFLAILAKNGILPHEEDWASYFLNQDIQELLNLSQDEFSESDYLLSESFDIIYAVYRHDYFSHHELHLCRSKAKKAWDKTRHFVKEHKKEILIGAAVIVAVAVTVTVVVMTCGTASGGVIAAAGAALTQLEEDNDGEQFTLQESPNIIPKLPLSESKESEAPQLLNVIENQISSLKELISENMANQSIQL